MPDGLALAPARSRASRRVPGRRPPWAGLAAAGEVGADSVAGQREGFGAEEFARQGASLVVNAHLDVGLCVRIQSVFAARRRDRRRHGRGRAESHCHRVGQLRVLRTTAISAMKPPHVLPDRWPEPRYRSRSPPRRGNPPGISMTSRPHSPASLSKHRRWCGYRLRCAPNLGAACG